MSYYIFCSRAFNIGLQGEMKKLNGVIEWRWEVESWYRQKEEEGERSWDEEMDGEEDRERESLAPPDLCDAFHRAAFLI